MTTTAATTYTATLPNGETVTRKSKRTYTHFYAKKLKPEITDATAIRNVGTDWNFGGFSSSQALAEKAAAATSWGMFDWIVLEISAPE
jgi:hypothetical protein